MFLNNAWYVAAWGNEIVNAPFARTICDEPVLMFRREDGSVAAISDRCPHRFAPLHRGKLLPGDRIQCHYHGMEFDGSGACVHNPHGDGRIPKMAQVRSYPVVERYSLIWLWWGDPAAADESLIPDFSCLGPGYATVGGVIEMDANYELITDNLMDLTHAEFLHEGVLGSEAIKRGKHVVRQEGLTVHSDRWCPDGIAPPAWDAAFGNYGKSVDHWLYMRWDAPAHMLLDVGVTPTGRPREEGIGVWGTDILTPATMKSTHYFWGISRTYAMDDPATDDLWNNAIDHAFVHQDKPMIEAVQRMMGDRTYEEMGPVLFSIDAGASRPRRVLRELIERERVMRGEERAAG